MADAVDGDLVGFEVLEDGLDSDLMIGEFKALGHLFAAVGCMSEATAGETDALAGALGRNRMRISIDDLVFQG